MNFQEFVSRLVVGQLKLTTAIDDTDKTLMKPEFKESVLNLTNQGLLDISTRIPIIKRQVGLTFEDGRYTYILDAANTATYLDDSLDVAFVNDNFIKVLDIRDSEGRVHSTNTHNHIMVPTVDSIRFTQAKMTELAPGVTINYQAKHPFIADSASTDALMLPTGLELALQLFVSAMFFSHMNNEELSAKGDSYYGAYLRAIGKDKEDNNSSTSEVYDDTEKFNSQGFV